ncbi:MAG: RNA-binding domain-containing protein [Candidatus Omnitrophota bacterium]
MPQIDTELISKLLNAKESQLFECKQIKKKPSEVLPTICAFANTDGGIFIYGLGDPGKIPQKERIVGTSEHPDNVGELLKLIASEFEPPIPNIKTFYLDVINCKGENDQVLMISVDPSRDVHSIRTGKTFIRRGTRNDLLTHKQSLQLQYEKGTITFESEICKDISPDEFDQAMFKGFLEYNDSKEKDILKFLSKNGLARRKDDKFYLTNAAILLFGENPSVLLKRKVGIKIIHYLGIRRVASGNPNFVRPPFTIEGPALILIKKTFKYISENAAPVQLKGATFQRLKIPLYVIQEAITNAIIHRDYSIQNDIQIRIFDDRIEIESPGWFPGLVTPESILQERFARNPMIERTLRKMPEPPNLDIGEGVKRMFAEMKKKDLYAPVYLPKEYSPHSVSLILFNEERTTFWDMVSNYLEQNGTIRNEQFRHISGLGRSEASEMLKKWVSKGLLEKKGTSRKSTFYQKPGFKPKKESLLENVS